MSTNFPKDAACMDFLKYMQAALTLAEKAAELGEVPVGCIIADRDGEIIGRGYNLRESKKSALSHAETEAIAEACTSLGDWRLEGCTIFVTLEPCPMCAGAIINARIPRVVYGARDENMGACTSVLNIFEERFGHKPAIYAGIMAEECGAVLKKFFQKLR